MVKSLRTGLSVLVCIIVLAAMSMQAQQKGQYIPGEQGLNAGILPEPGITYANMTINYSADTLKNGAGGSIPLTSSYDIWANMNIFYYVPKARFMRAKVAFMVMPAFANGSLTLGSLDSPNSAVNAGGEGFADLWVQPVALGWSFKRADVYAGYGFVAPTGRYSPGASNNVGSGYWGNHIISGSTVYLTKNKGTTANLFTDWEIHGHKTTGSGTSMTPGQAFTMEWGLGQTLPLKKDFSSLLQVGVVGYDQWQVTANGGMLTPLVPASITPYYSVQSIGFQTNLVLPPKNLLFFFRFEDEYSALARPEGRTISFGGSWTLRIPKPLPPKPPAP